MKIVVAGGTGTIGSWIVEALEDGGHEAVVACRGSGVDTSNAQGLRHALDQAGVVIDATDAPSLDERSAMNFFEESTRNLLSAGKAMGVQHHVVLSMVGVDVLGHSGYLRAKLHQERVVAASGHPYSIVRSTQVMERISSIADVAGDPIVVPAVRVRPLAARDLAGAVVDVSTAPPSNSVVEVAGPQSVAFDEVVRDVLSVCGDPRAVVAEPDAGYLGGAAPREDALLPGPGAILGSTRIDDWVRDATWMGLFGHHSTSSSARGETRPRSRINLRNLPPEALIDALVEWQSLPRGDPFDVPSANGDRCEIPAHPPRPAVRRSAAD